MLSCKKIFWVALIVLAGAVPARAHCEIPCGIYDDQQRIDMIREDITTIEKSMTMIEQLSREDPVNYNQLIRWVDNKEAHAQKIQDVVFQYFMTQRIKPSAVRDPVTGAAQQLHLLHELAVEAMKAKQTVDPAHVKAMRDLTSAFAESYFRKAEMKEVMREE